MRAISSSFLLHSTPIFPPNFSFKSPNNVFKFRHTVACRDSWDSSDAELEHDLSEKMPDTYQLGFDVKAFDLLLEQCLSLGSVIDARRIHAKILKLGFDKTCHLCCKLADAYFHFGDLDDTLKLFDCMPKRSFASLNSFFDGLLRRKDGRTILALVTSILRECKDPSPIIFASALRACSGGRSMNLHFVDQIHAKSLRLGLSFDPIIGNPLIDCYAKNGHVDSAKMVFEELHTRDNVSWVAMVSGLSQNGFLEEALQLYCDMWRSRIAPTPYIFSSLLSVCAKSELIVHGMQLHSQIIKLGFENETFIGNALVTLYSRCRNMRLAERILSEMANRDGVTYNAVISGHARYGDSERSLAIFKDMKDAGIAPDCVTIASLLSACATLGAICQGRQLHAYVWKAGLSSDYVIEGSILDLYVNCADLETAREFFDNTDQQNVVLWNVMLVAYGQMGNLTESFNLFRQMQFRGLEPNQYTYPSILRTCTYAGAINIGEQIHTLVIKTGFESNVYVSSVLIDMYSKCGRLYSAQQILNRLTEEDVVSWTAMIAGYAQHEHFPEALTIFNEMRFRGIKPDNIGLSSAISACAGMKSVEQGRQIHTQAVGFGYSKDVSIGNSLVNLYARCGQIKDAYSAFRTIENKDEVSWNGLISGFAQSGNYEESLRVFVKMDKGGIKANLFTYGSVVSAAANLADVKQGRQIHARIIKTGNDSEVEAGNAIISLYAKCGCIEDARTEFYEMPERNEISWNAIITCFSQHGCGRKALKVFEQMKEEGFKPNDVTFLAVLAACSHVGLVDQGVEYFDSMNQVHSLIPRIEHYACVVDILGRAGQLVRARQFIDKMPIQPDAMVWRTLLSACTVHKNMDIGEFAAQRLLELEPHDSANYVLLSNIYALAKKWNKRDQVRQMMKERGVKKEPGRSWIEVKNKVHSFFVGDKLHPLSNAIYDFLEDLNRKAVDLGYKQDSYCLLNEIELEQKDASAFIHSEKIAVAFGLMSLSAEIPICVIKNLRVCNDCHAWMKIVSRITERSIILRDAYRFHHFEGGSCSCRDYW